MFMMGNLYMEPCLQFILEAFMKKNWGVNGLVYEIHSLSSRHVFDHIRLKERKHARAHGILWEMIISLIMVVES